MADEELERIVLYKGTLDELNDKHEDTFEIADLRTFRTDCPTDEGNIEWTMRKELRASGYDGAIHYGLVPCLQSFVTGPTPPREVIKQKYYGEGVPIRKVSN